VSGASLCADWDACVYWRGDDDYARRAAVFEDFGGTRDARLWIECRGLERRGFTKERIKKIHHAYRVLLASKLNTSQALEKLKAEADRGEDVEMLIRLY
jgi:acyl-[acyl carrier protein]--UDP-N-acetylglucosamine O-acyltransferase